MNKRIHLIIKGRVQGVFYRENTRKMAHELGLTGFVRNLVNGDVEVIAEGDEENLKRLLDWCWKGPEEAVVNDIKVNWEDYKKEYRKFSIV
jgi:acylphosphatase